MQAICKIIFRKCGNQNHVLRLKVTDQLLRSVSMYSLGSFEPLRRLSNSAISLNRTGSYLFSSLPWDFSIYWVNDLWCYVAIQKSNLDVFLPNNWQKTPTYIIMKNGYKAVLARQHFSWSHKGDLKHYFILYIHIV